MPKVTIDDVVGVGEIGEMLGVSKQYAWQLMDRPEAPKFKQLARMRVWLKPDVVKYARETLHREVREDPVANGQPATHLRG